MKKVLISCFFPPYSNPSGNYFNDYLNSLNNEFDVYMFKERNFDSSLKISDKTNLIEIGNIRSGNTIVITFKLIYFITVSFFKLFFNKYDQYYSASFEVLNHVPILFLKKFRKLHWTVIIAEPLIGNKKHFNNVFIYKIVTYIEKKSIEKADNVILLSEGLLTHYSNNCVNFKNYDFFYPKYKNEIICKPSRIEFLYAGSLYEKRSIIPFLDLVENCPSEFSVKIVGKITEIELDKITKHNIFNKVEILYQVPQKKLDSIIINASHLIVIDEEIENDDYNYLYPSKLSYYFSTSLPIIGFTRNESITKTILEKSGNISFHESNKDIWNDLFLKYYNNEISLDLKYYKSFKI